MWRLGLIDSDSSHSVEFTRRFNHVGVDREQYVHGGRVVAAWPGDSTMAPERMPGFCAELASINVPLVDCPEDLIGRIDAVLVLSLCGAAHLARVRPFLKAGIPAFVDKPFACSLPDALAMVELSRSTGTPLFNASGLRFSGESVQFQARRSDLGAVLGAVTCGPSKRADGNPGLFHYGIHAVELLLELMGTGCESVTCCSGPAGEAVTGLWSDGRIGTVRGIRQGATPYGFQAFCERGQVSETVSTRYTYRNLCQAIVTFLETRQPPVSHESSLEAVRFVLAALESERHGGTAVRLGDVT